jgi:AraC-like DNA-binding protein
MARRLRTIAATSTLAMVCAAETRGVATADLLERVGLTRYVLDDPDARIPAPVVLAVWNALRERTGDPALQLRAPTSLPFGAYRIIDYLVGASATVGVGVRRFAGYFRLIADGITLTVEEEGEGHSLRLEVDGGGPVPAVYVDYVFAALVSRIRMRIRPTLQVHRVELRQRKPAATAPYFETFRAPVRFGAVADRLYFSAAEWNAPMQSADEPLAVLLEEHARILARRNSPDVSDFRSEVERAMASAPAEHASAEHVARALHVSVRTLQRKLVAAGTTFREVADRVRGELAQEHLADPRTSITEVTYLLGFSDETSFTRAFRRWTGESPGRWRRRVSGAVLEQERGMTLAATSDRASGNQAKATE